MDRERLYCSKSPQYQLPIILLALNMWMILPVFLVFLPLTNSFDKLILQPTDPFVFVGDCIEFTCTLNSTTLNDTSAIYFTHNSIISPQSEMTFNNRYVTLKKCFNSSREKGSYLCKYSDSSEYAGQWVEVEEKFIPIPKDSINCIVSDWQELNCTWNLGQKYIFEENLSLDICYSYLASEMCKPASLTWQSLNRKEMNLEIPLNITVTVHYKHKSIDLQRKTYLHLNASKPIQPSTVDNVQLNFNDTCVYMEWTHRYYYKVSYLLILETMDSKTLNFSVKDPKFCFCELAPFMEYKLEVYTLLKRKVGLYSEPYVNSFISNKSIPKHPPWITDGCFERDYTDVNSVTLIWKGLKRKEFGDESVQYLIQNKDLNITTSQNRLKFKLSLNTSSCENIIIWAKNSVGQSKSPSPIRICDKSKVPGSPQNIEAISINSTTVLITWERPRNNHTKIGRYTVYGCHKENCSSNFMWLYVSGNHTSKMLSMNTDISAYTFAVSAENEEGSSGLLWTSCYLALKKPIQPVQFHVKAKENAFIVEWEHYNCNTEKAYISNYIVSYCKSDSPTDCQDKIQERNVSKTEKKYQIKDLSKNDYLVWVKSSTSVGDSPVVTKKLIHVSGQRVSIELIFVPIISIIAIIVLITLISLYVNRTRKSIDKISIEYPQVKTENNYHSITRIPSRDSETSCINDEAYDSSSVLMIVKLCPNSSPEIDENKTHLFEKPMPNNSRSGKDFNNRVINVKDLQSNASKVQLPEFAMYTDDKETEFTGGKDETKETSSKNNDDLKNDTYIRAVPSFTCLNLDDMSNNSNGYIGDNIFAISGKSGYISNSPDIEDMCFGGKSYNCNSTDTVDKAVTQN